MNILLIKASHINNIQLAIIPPLGLLYIASSIRKYFPEDHIKIYDCRIKGKDDVARVLAEYKPDIVGISTDTLESSHALEIAQQAKVNSPQTIVLMGGPHPTSYNDDVLRNHHVDYTILHEGEQTVCDLLGAIKSSLPIESVKGIGYRDANGEPAKSAPQPYIDDLDNIPHPAWDLIDFSDYAKVKSMSLIGPRRVAPIFTSRACPYRCTYCHDMFGKKFQKRSVSNVLDEMEILVHQYNVRHFEIIDDIFNIDKIRTREILQGILDRKLDVRLAFPNGLRGDLLTEDLVDLFARAGTEYVSLAIESGSPRLQKQIRKHLKLDKIQDAIRWFADRRVFTNCFFMIGFPSETKAEMKQTIDFACRQPSHTSMFFLVTPFEGTELANSLKGQQATVHKDFDKFSYATSDLNITGTVSTEELQKTVRWAYFKYICNPYRIFRLFRDHPNKGYLVDMGILVLRRVFFDNIRGKDRLDKITAALKLNHIKKFFRIEKKPAYTSS